MNKKLVLLALGLLIQGCNKIDDYMLGKDNTPQPKELKQISAKLNVSPNWSVAVGKSNKNTGYLKLQPVALGRFIYTADSSGLVQAVNQSNGKVRWSTVLKNNLVSGPSVAEGIVAVGTNNSSLIVLDKTTGKELWQVNLSGELLSAPAIAHHKIIAKTIDGRVYAFDKAGKQLWAIDHGSPNLVLKASSSPVIVGNLVLIGFSDGKLEAFELDSGRTVWQRSMAYATGSSDVERLVDIDADPIIRNNMAYLATYQGYIGALSLENGEFAWRKPGSVYKNILLHADNLYLTDSNDVLWSLDSKTGNVNWKQTALKARGLTEPVLIGSNLVVGDRSGYLHFLDTQAGDLLARTQVSGGINSAPIAVGRKLYVLTNNGMLNELTVS